MSNVGTYQVMEHGDEVHGDGDGHVLKMIKLQLEKKKEKNKNKQPVRLAGSYRCWFVKKYCWLVCVREKYCSGWKFTIVYDKPQPNEQGPVTKRFLHM